MFEADHPGMFASGFDNRIFYGITSDDQLIQRIRTAEPGGDLDGILYDDIQFGRHVIPEPNSLASLALVLLITFFRQRKTVR